MAFTKFAKLEVSDILDLKGSRDQSRTASLAKLAEFEDYRTEDGYLYARIRAISSRVNRNHDGWPSVELAGGPDIFDRHMSSTGGFTVAASAGARFGFSTFLGKPVFVDHHNSNPTKRARGVVVDAKLHVEDARTASSLDPYYASAPDNHKPPTWVELLLEVDAKTFPVLAKAIIEGAKDPSRGINGFSMGCNVEMSKCSHCGNEARSPDDYCQHIRRKGMNFSYTDPHSGRTSSKRSYEDCYGIQFFEMSGVFEPADETALTREVRASVQHESTKLPCEHCHGRGMLQLDNHGFEECQVCQGTGTQGQDVDFGQPRGEGANTPGRIGPSDVTLDSMALNAPRRVGGAPFEVDPTLVQDEVARILEHHPDIDPATAEDLAKRRILKDQPMSDVPGGDGAFSEAPKRWDYSDMPQPIRDRVQHPGPSELWPDAPPAHPKNDPFMSNTKTAESDNVLDEQNTPQVDLVRAPDGIDTLREEKVCPVCGQAMDDEECEICGYVEEPKGFDDPDLEKARQNDAQADPDADGVAGGNLIPPDAPPKPTELLDGINPPQKPAPRPRFDGFTGQVTSDMGSRWQIVTPHIAGRINTTERPIRPGNDQATDEPQGQIISDQSKPVTSSVRTAGDFIDAARNLTENNMKIADAASGAPEAASPDKRVDVTGQGGVMDASNEAAAKANAQVAVDAKGGTGVEDVAPDSTNNVDKGNAHTKNIEGTPTDTWSGTEGQTDPVQGDVFPNAAEGVKRSHDDGAFPADDGGLSGGGAKSGTDPADPSFKAQDRVDVLDHVTSPSNNSGATKTWSGTEGNGVTRQQDPTTTDSIATEGFGKGSNAHLFKAMQLAELEVDLGLLAKEQKFARVAELTDLAPTEVEAEFRVARRVKQAGLAKQAAATVKRVPSMGRAASVKEAARTEDDTLLGDSALFS